MIAAINKRLQADVSKLKKHCLGYHRSSFRLFIVLLVLESAACTTETTSSSFSTGSNGQKQAPRSFFDKLTDEITERECNVVRFTCPYGFGPAGEPCDCTDPRGVVLQGRTVK